MSLHWGGEAVRKLLSPQLYARIHEAFVNPRYNLKEPWTLNQYDGSTGEVLMETPMPLGAMRVSRSRMRKLFSEGIDVKVSACLIFISIQAGIGIEELALMRLD